MSLYPPASPRIDDPQPGVDNFCERRAFARFGRLSTFDILIHLLETVDFYDLVDQSDRTKEVASLSLPSWHRRWHVAWQFLMSEDFVERYELKTGICLLRLSNEGRELKAELRDYCEENLTSGPLAPVPRNPEEPILSITSSRGTDFQLCIHRVIEVQPLEELTTA